MYYVSLTWHYHTQTNGACNAGNSSEGQVKDYSEIQQESHSAVSQIVQQYQVSSNMLYMIVQKYLWFLHVVHDCTEIFMVSSNMLYTIVQKYLWLVLTCCT